MPIDLVKLVGDTATCERCNSAELPAAMFLDRSEDWHLTLCPLCLADAIETVTGWQMRRIVSTYAHIGGLKERHADPDSDTRRPKKGRRIR